MASQWGPAAEPVPVPSEMMQVVRDEQDLVTDMVREQLAKERDTIRSEDDAQYQRCGDGVEGGRVARSTIRGRGDS